MSNNIHPSLDAENQKRAKEYTRSKRIINILGQIAGWAVLLFLYLSGFSEAFIKSTSTIGFLPQLFLLFFCLTTAQQILTFYFDYLNGFKIEHKYGFSHQDFTEWFTDKIKSYILTVVIGTILLILLFLCFKFFTTYWWIFAALGMILVSVVMSNLFPILIIPIFYDLEPIEDRDLKEKLKKILKKGNIKIKGFFSMNMSSKTSKENAMLAGLFNTKRVILGDTLMERNSDDEIEAILSHEVGHHIHKHTWKNILMGCLQVLIIFFFIDLILGASFPKFLTNTSANLILLPLFLFLFNVLSFITNPIQLFVSRLNEKQADKAALDLSGKVDAFISSMAGLANRNLSDAYPSPFIKFLFYQHPPIGERIEFAEEYASDQ